MNSEDSRNALILRPPERPCGPAYIDRDECPEHAARPDDPAVAERPERPGDCPEKAASGQGEQDAGRRERPARPGGLHREHPTRPCDRHRERPMPPLSSDPMRGRRFAAGLKPCSYAAMRPMGTGLVAGLKGRRRRRRR